MRVASSLVTLTTLFLLPACMEGDPGATARETSDPGVADTGGDSFDGAPPAPGDQACSAEGESCYVDGDCCAGLCNGGACHGSCTPGSTQACYSGPAGTDGVGTCHPGVQTCDAYGTGFGPCVGEVLPAAEACDSLDTDCDGDPTDGCGGGVCEPGSTRSCYDGPAGTADQGTCASGTETCAADGSGYGACVGATTPLAEVCGDGLDTDCDGTVDDGCVCVADETEACYDGPPGTDSVGNCRAGERTCLADGSGFGACVGEVTPQPATCGNGIDDDADCDGTVDPACGVGGRIWIDGSGDNTELNDEGDPERTGPVTTFILRDALTGALVAVAVSDEETGDYFFPGLPLGTYYIEAELSFPWEPAAQDTGDDTIDNDFDHDTRRTPSFVYLGGRLLDIDLGLLSFT